MTAHNDDVQRIIDALRLKPLPMEGGLFDETWRSERKVEGADRRAGTCIHYLLKRGNRSFWHRLPAEEFWFFHAGDPAVQLLLFPDGAWTRRRLGPEVANGDIPQSLIPAGAWQATVPLTTGKHGYSLFSAIVVPGFEFEDYESGDPKRLIEAWPAAAAAISELGLDHE